MRYYFSKAPLQVAFLGLDNAGKSTLIKHICNDITLTACSPTYGSNYRNYELQVESGCANRTQMYQLIDLGGEYDIRGIWSDYYGPAAALVFVFDASDATRFAELREELQQVHRLCSEQRKPLLVVGNKQDLNCKITDVFDFYQYFNMKLFQARQQEFATVSAIERRQNDDEFAVVFDAFLTECITHKHVKHASTAETKYARLTSNEKLQKMDELRRRNDEIDALERQKTVLQRNVQLAEADQCGDGQ